MKGNGKASATNSTCPLVKGWEQRRRADNNHHGHGMVEDDGDYGDEKGGDDTYLQYAGPQYNRGANGRSHLRRQRPRHLYDPEEPAAPRNRFQKRQRPEPPALVHQPLPPQQLRSHLPTHHQQLPPHRAKPQPGSSHPHHPRGHVLSGREEVACECSVHQ